MVEKGQHTCREAHVKAAGVVITQRDRKDSWGQTQTVIKRDNGPLKLGVDVLPVRPAVAGLHEHALHGLPQAVLAGAAHGVHFPLSLDGPAVLLPGDGQQGVCGPVPEPNRLLALPHTAAALHRPLVQVVPLALFAERTHLLVGGKWRGEVVAVKVTTSVDMSEADGLTTFDRSPTVTHTILCPTNAPVTVAVFHCGNPGNRLLTATRAVAYVV